ncbi:outer membrane beta-barrel protein [Flavobacterium sp. CBA20B-1]|uniref:CsgG/HfaB family protein n=1 Tax=unclassified Flavobacterium TaxID=196869 RepID=UPI002224FB81|nr:MULTISPECIES: CsgG/HfaB family protein [unclassified Flavobacterium]WCM43348.1 outer membrane beta-barrel protein [Flavobacterium sp. CBA20B-1]
MKLSTKNILLLLCLGGLFQACGVFFSPPAGVEYQSVIGEVTATEKDFKKLPKPQEPIVVGVYKFRDQTGQYKASATGANWSTAVPQGLTTILIKSLEDSKWFAPIERENIGNLLNERQIIRTTRQEYTNGQAKETLAPLLFAGILLEGGVISYDTNILTGGAGARYFGIGGSTEYRQDRITVYLRAVSTNSGKILKTIYTSKTILSQSVNASMFRYVDTERLMEAEVGVTNNEPVQMAVSEAINKAVYLLILEGIKNNVWNTTNQDKSKADALLAEYTKEVAESTKRIPGKGDWDTNRRAKFSIGASVTANSLRGDYAPSTSQFGASGNFKYLFSDHFSLNAAYGYQTLNSDRYFKAQFTSLELDLEYLMLPFNNFTPYFSAGLGSFENITSKKGKLQLKSQFGAGLEYMVSPSVGIRGFGKYHVGFTDDWDEVISGKRNDHFLQFGMGVQVYLGK